MLTGITLLGIVTASLASWLIHKVRETEEHTKAATRADVVALTADLQAVRHALAVRGLRCPRRGQRGVRDEASILAVVGGGACRRTRASDCGDGYATVVAALVVILEMPVF
jgi:voltage-gated potassium channel